MRYLAILFCLTITLSSNAQERLTSIVNEVLEELIYVQKVEGINYVLKTNPKDELKVYRLNDDFTLEHLHTNIFDDVHTDFFVRIIDEHVYLVDGIEPVKYNFVANEEVRYTLPEGWFASIWQNADSRLPSISSTNAANSDFKTFHLEADGNVFEADEENSNGPVIENYIVKTSYPVNNRRSLFVENIDSGQRDTLVLNATSYIDYVIENNSRDLVYIDLDAQICKFDGQAGSKVCIPSFIYDSNKYETFRWLEDWLVVSHRDEDQVSVFSTLDGSQTHFFDLEDFSSFSSDDLFGAQILQDKIVIQTNGDAFVLDLINQNISEYDTHSTRWYSNPIFDNRYFIAFDYVLLNNEYVLANKLVDLIDYTETDLNFNGQINMSDYAKVISVGDDYVGAFWSWNNLEDIIYRISIDNMSMEHEPSIQPKSAQGLPGNTTELFKLGENLAFVTEDSSDGEVDHIYAVDGDQVDLVVSEIIYDFYPSGFVRLKDKLTYATEREDHWDIYSFDGKIPTLEATFPMPTSFGGPAGFLEDYVITNDNVFAVIQSIGFDNSVNLMRYNKADGTVEALSELHDIFFVPLATDGENTYFYTDFSLYHVDENGVSESILTVKEEGIISGVLRQSGEHTYFLSMDGIFILEGKEAIQIYDKPIDFSLLDLEFSESKDYVEGPLMFDISFDVEHTLLYVDGSSAREVNVGSSVSSVIPQENNNFFVVTTPDATGPRRDLLYNASSDELYDLTYLGLEENLLNIHELSNSAYIVTYERFATVLNIYRMSDDFSTADLVFTSPVDSYTSDPNFKILAGEGMLYTNDFIFQVDEDYQFYELDVVGNGSTPEMEINEDGYIYFIAKDEEFGNQLYRIGLVSFRISTDDIRSIENISVYPNPANEVINLPNQLKGGYMLLNQLGQIVATGILTNSKIDIRHLESGVYYLKVENMETIYISTIVISE